MKILIDDQFRFFDIDISSFLPHVADSELTASSCGSEYRQISNISSSKSQNLNVSCLVLQLP